MPALQEILVDDVYVVTGSTNLTQCGTHTNVESQLLFRAGPVFDVAEVRWTAAVAEAVHALQATSTTPTPRPRSSPAQALASLVDINAWVSPYVLVPSTDKRDSCWLAKRSGERNVCNTFVHHEVESTQLRASMLRTCCKA